MHALLKFEHVMKNVDGVGLVSDNRFVHLSWYGHQRVDLI